jgi:hypothetical protein
VTDYPYITAPAALRRFMDQIPTSGVPNALSHKELEGRGFKSHNYRPIISILKFIKFLDTDGKPTDAYRQFRSREVGPAVLAAAIREAYADLFTTYPDAYNKDVEALRNFFSTHSEGGERVQDAIVGTFRTICGVADFGADAPPADAVPASDPRAAGVKRSAPTSPSPPTPPGLVINLNIQLALPATDNAEVYDKIFASLKKHLM